MTNTKPIRVAHCRCGAVEIGAWAEPIVVATCYCDDCQAAAQRFAESTKLAPAWSADGGTDFMMFRRDRIACMAGAENLKMMKLTAMSKTRRMFAFCCTTPMYAAFDDKRPWVSAFRASFGADAPPVEMRICTRFRQSKQAPQDRLPGHPGYPPRMILRILAAWPLVLISQPVGALP